MLLHRHRRAVAAVGVHHAVPRVAGHVDRAVDDEAGRVHRIVAVAEQIAVAIDLDQRGGRYFLEEHPKGIEQEMVLRAWYAQ